MFSNFLNWIYVNHATHKERRLEHHGVNYGFQWNFPPTAKKLPGKITFQGNLSGQLGLSASSQDVKGSGQIGAQFAFDGPSLRSSISGNGQIEASWILDKKKSGLKSPVIKIHFANTTYMKRSL